MKASYNWLKEFVDFNLPHRELAHTLTMAGFEVEAIEEVEDDIIFDIGVTPNRPDCLSIIGIAREISAVLDLPLKDVNAEIRKQEGGGPLIEIKAPDLCLRYSSRMITGVKPGPSPEWLVKRLEAHDIRSTSNIVDITNYVLLETGQPLHAFDLDKLAGNKIVVNRAGNENEFHTLDNEKRTLNKDTLLIWDDEKPVAIAGVMGGLNSEVSQSTRNILLESAFFNPVSVRRTSKFINLKTESSYRFERGVDMIGVKSALDRAACLIADIAGGKVSHITDIYPDPYTPRKLCVKYKKINSVIGIDIDESFVENVLTGLGFKIKREGDGIVVTPPSFRQDIQRDVDIIEEVVRLYGYDRIPSTLPAVQMISAPVHKTQEAIKSIKNAMVKSGFSEAINYSFLNPEIMDKLNIPPEDRRRKTVFIKNPLRKEEEAMRTTLIPALLNNVSLNLNRGAKTLRLFEVSRVFLPSGQKLPDEVIQMCAIYHKGMSASIWDDKHDGFYDLKGVLENLFSELGIRDYSFIQEATSCEPYLHPGKSCAITVNGEKTGSLGTLHPSVSTAFDISGNINILELYDIEKIQKAVSPTPEFVSLPRYPYVERDLAIVVSKDITVGQAKETITGIDSDIIEAVSLFDIYTGKPVPDNKKSLAFSIRYRASDRTLTDSEVDVLHSGILRRLEENLKAELRA
ncbi:MAG: phenylalanine--tRNA ligase subunit beta [Thermodesulfovibrionia bacterium]|nr:phenylalanine--tRNA ligase subunit beta [Thermodesulfovibrionia bacterium]